MTNKIYIVKVGEDGYGEGKMVEMEQPSDWDHYQASSEHQLRQTSIDYSHCVKYENHLASLPVLLLHPSFKVKAGDWVTEWVEVWEGYLTQHTHKWLPITKDEYEECVPEYRRKVLLPKEEEKKGVETICQKCGGYNPVWSADNELWNKVIGSSNGIICPTCFIREANDKGIEMFGLFPNTPSTEEKGENEKSTTIANLIMEYEAADFEHSSDYKTYHENHKKWLVKLYDTYFSQPNKDEALKSVELVEAKDKRIKELDDSYQHQSKLLYKKDTDLMIDVDRIEQLKKLIEKAHEAGYNDYEKYTLFLSWLGFKTDNNL